MKLTQRTVGIGLTVLAIILAIIGYLYVHHSEQYILSQANVTPEGECIHEGDVCPYEQINTLETPKIAGSILLAMLFLIGTYLVVKKQDTLPPSISTPKTDDAKKQQPRVAPKSLSSEEKQIYDFVSGADGMLYQNEIVEKTQFSKVKVTRVLDKLEAKGLIERRRRGMTNVVILKP